MMVFPNALQAIFTLALLYAFIAQLLLTDERKEMIREIIARRIQQRRLTRAIERERRLGRQAAGMVDPWAANMCKRPAGK